MCHQAVSLVQAEIEGRGIVTASITMLPEVTAKVRPPRALAVPYKLGFAVGAAHDAEQQRQVLEALLRLLDRQDVPLVMQLEEVLGAGMPYDVRARRT